MHVTETSLQGLISGTKQFRVPLFQRPYTWTEPNHKQLWRDIIRHYEADRDGAAASAGHFIGSFVLAPTPSSAAVPAYLIVDGQQRLTTLTLALCALRDAAAATDPQAYERVTNQYLVNPYAQGEHHWKLVPTDEDKDAYFACIDGRAGDGQDSRIAAAYRFFAVKLTELDRDDEPLDLTLLETVIVTKLSIIDITAQATDNVHRIFESLNATGVGLTQADLLRNYLFMLLPSGGAQLYYDVWKPMQEELGAEHLEGLARVDLRRRGIEVRDDDVYRAQQARIGPFEQDEAAVESQVRDLAIRARHYACILFPDREANPQIRRALAFLHRWKATTAHPVVMYLYERREDGHLTETETVEALLYIEGFLIRRLLVGTPTNNLNRIFLQLVSHLRQHSDNPIAKELRAFLSTERKFWATDDDVRTAARQRPFFLHGRADQRRLVLERLEESYGHKEMGDLSQLPLSVEHVMPRTLTPEWIASLAAEDEDPDRLHGELVHTLGNLTLTAYNPELSNSPFERKKQLYRDSHLSLSRQLVEPETWGRNEIDGRAIELADRAMAIWPGPVAGVSGTTAQFDWSRMRAAIAAIPAGHWTAYVDLAALVGTAAQAVGNHIATNPTIPGAWRVLTADGRISDGFRWGDADDERDPTVILAQEGVRFDNDRRADDAQRLRTDDLHEIVSRYDTEEDRNPETERTVGKA